MARYAAFLRGINLGPINKISMPVLRELAASLGYTDVQTHLNSGNLIFTATGSAADAEQQLMVALREQVGKNIDVAVRTPEQLQQILAANPYPDGNPSQVTVAFLMRPAPAGAEERVAAVAAEHEPFTFAGTEVYVHYSHGLGTSKLAEKFSAVIGVSATVRNLNTVRKVLALAEDQRRRCS